MIHSHLTKLLFALILLFNTNAVIAQTSTISNCTDADVISGNIHGHLDCARDILITSTSAEGTDGTIISGDIITTGVVNITPGYSKVRIVAPEEDGQNQRVLPHNRDRKTHIGNGSSGTGGRQSNNSYTLKNKHHQHDKNNSLILYPNPAKDFIDFSNYKNLITGYQVSNSQGRILLEGEFGDKNHNHKISIKHLKEGFYVINMPISTGEIITKLLIKE